MELRRKIESTDPDVETIHESSFSHSKKREDDKSHDNDRKGKRSKGQLPLLSLTLYIKRRFVMWRSQLSHKSKYQIYFISILFLFVFSVFFYFSPSINFSRKFQPLMGSLLREKGELRLKPFASSSELKSSFSKGQNLEKRNLRYILGLPLSQEYSSRSGLENYLDQSYLKEIEQLISIHFQKSLNKNEIMKYPSNSLVSTLKLHPFQTRQESTQNATQKNIVNLKIIIRMYGKQKYSMRSLIWSLRSQQYLYLRKVNEIYNTIREENDGKNEARGGEIAISTKFYLMPTEPDNLNQLKIIKEEMCEGGPMGYMQFTGRQLNCDVEIIEIPNTFFVQSKAKNPYKCSPEWRKDYLQWATMDAISKYCDYENYVHYVATDYAIREVLEDNNKGIHIRSNVLPTVNGKNSGAESPTYILITNGDNAYHPNYIESIVDTYFAKFSFPDVIVTDFFTNIFPDIRPEDKNNRYFRKDKGKFLPIQAEAKLGSIDLGTILLKSNVFMHRSGIENKKIIEGENASTDLSYFGFISALPLEATAKDVHDADWWFFDHLRKLEEVNIQYLHENLFYHH